MFKHHLSDCFLLNVTIYPRTKQQVSSNTEEFNYSNSRNCSKMVSFDSKDLIPAPFVPNSQNICLPHCMEFVGITFM